MTKLVNGETSETYIKFPDSPTSVKVDTPPKLPEIWTHKSFDWAIRSPKLIEKGNSFVTEQWSEDYFIACKQGMSIVKESLSSALTCLKKGSIGDALKHLANALITLSKLAVNVQLGNFIKGLAGVAISAIKIPQHALGTAFYLLLMIGALISGKADKAKEYFSESISQAGFILKDVVSIITCTGHAIPSWVPAVAAVVCPPAGLALVLLKIASKFTGIFDVMAYGGTATLLGAKAFFAKRTLKTEPHNAEALKTTQAWSDLKKALNPLKSIEGATLATYGAHILATGAETVLDAFVPGASHVAAFGKMALQSVISYGAQGAVGAGLLTAVYRNRNEVADASQDGASGSPQETVAQT